MTPSLNYGYSIRLLTCLSLFLCTTGLNAQATSPGDMKVSVTGDHITYREVFNALRKQTGLWFVYSNEDFNQDARVTIAVKGETLDAALGGLFRGSGYTWSYHNKSVAIARVDGGKDSLITVTGRVVDEKGNPIIGASILLKGTKTGAVTNQDGIFNVKTVKPNGSLIVSSVGFLTKEIPVNNRMGMGQIQLKEYVGALDEIQVQAYGTTTRRLSTGNISTVKAEDIAKQPVNNPLLALQGRIPGMEIIQSSGLPGTGITVRIRGRNSMTQGNLPLYIIDGVPYTSELLPNIGNILGTDVGSTRSGNPLSYINPADIESIDILKDADATAIYGSRGANGVVLITTKKGKDGEFKGTINLQKGFGKITRKLKLLNTREYLDMRYEAFKNDGITTIPETAYDLKIWDTTRYTDWQKELIGGTAQYTDAQASVSGGSISTQYLISGNYHNETTVFPSDLSDQKGSIHLNINSVSANQKLRILLSALYTIDHNHLIRQDLTSNSITLAPNAPNAYNKDHKLNWAPSNSGISTWLNPLSSLSLKYKNHTNNFITNMVLSYHLSTKLELKSSFGYTNMQTDESAITPLSYYSPERQLSEGSGLRNANYTNNNINSYIVEPQVIYITNWKSNKLTFLLGATYQQNNNKGQILSATNFNSDAALADPKSAASVTIASTTSSIYKYNAAFCRLNYSYQDKYILNLTARRDGTSRFGPENQFHNFASAGAAWIISKESWIQYNLPLLSFGKFRISYGTTGSDQIGDYTFLNLYSPTNTSIPYQGVTGLQIDRLYNPELSWEETKKMEGGLELGFLKDKLLITTTYYHNRTSNQLIGYSLPQTTGFTNISKNLNATVQNNGWEFELKSFLLNSKKINWTSSLNITINRNKLTSVARGMNANYQRQVGHSLNSFYVYHFLGVDPITGSYLVSTKDGKPTDNPDYDKDATTLIDLTPKFYGGFQNSISFGAVSLDFLFQFVKQIGNNYLYTFIPGFYYGGGTNQPVTVLNRWQKPGDTKNIQRFSQNFDLYNSYNNAQQSNQVYSDASFIRLKNVSLSLQLPQKVIQKHNIKSASIYLHAQNLLTITNFIGIDPENRSSNSLPPLKLITLGIQLTM
jgi:TonB-linked SusC/RagA family outer membrane protein